MAETIQKGIIQEGIEIGEARGEVRGKINAIQKLLRIRFKHVPDQVADELNSRTDLIALESLFEVAYQCQSLDEFSEALK